MKSKFIKEFDVCPDCVKKFEDTFFPEETEEEEKEPEENEEVETTFFIGPHS